LTSSPPSSGAELLVHLDRSSRESLSRQIQQELRRAIQRGSLRAGARLPSTRGLAADLGISRPVVVDAYEQLAAEGYLHTRPGARPVVAQVSGRPEATTQTQTPPARDTPILHDLRPAMPSLSMFPRKTWLRMLRQAMSEMPASAFGYDGRHGTHELRHALADYLGRVRGVIVDPQRIIVTSGFAEARALACAAFVSLGVRRLGVEDPGYSSWESVDRSGLVRVPVAVDTDGMAVGRLDARKVQAVMVTPAHQFPMGVVLSKARRRQLVEWLEARDALAFEDDYDAEFRYDQQPLGALQGLAPERVLYAGTVSKTLAPALRLGWLVVPGRIVDAVKAEQRRWNEGCPRIDQNALAAFIASGEYDRHLRLMRRVYRTRRDALMAAIAEFLPQAQARGIAAGLHVTLGLPEAVDEAAVCEALALRGVAVEPMGKYRLSSDKGPPTLLLGYGGASERSLREAVRIMATAMGSRRR
jgi:GntR family transcriptional regulator/MocR family aminotransferase